MRKYVYADEAGNFDFSNNHRASKYFILTTVVIEDHSIATELFELRRELVWDGFDLSPGFHATEDRQIVRDAVFEILRRHHFRVDATILEKRKAQPQLTALAMRFYKYAWFYHMKYVAPRIATNQDELLVVAASLAIKAKKTAFSDAIRDVVEQTATASAWRNVVWPAATDPCLQIADYCSWAIQRKWESGDDRSYDLIHSKIGSEYDLFSIGNQNLLLKGGADYPDTRKSPGALIISSKHQLHFN